MSPIQPTDNRLRIVLVGSWYNSSATDVRAAGRVATSTPTVRSYFVGFRCAQRGARMPLTGGDL